MNSEIRRVKWISLFTLPISLVCFGSFLSVAEAAFTAYNDCAWTANSGQTPSANDITGNFTTNSPLALLSGILKDSTTAAQTGVQVAFDTSQAVGLNFLDRTFGPPSGSDAATWFTGKIGTNCAVNWTLGTVKMTFSGMNPSARYNIVLWSTRGGDTTAYSNRLNDITISGADLFTNKSSTGTQWFTNSMANDKTRVRACLASGQVVRYDGINPGTDGSVSFNITAGADMLWPPTAGSTNAYLNAFMMQEFGGTSSGSTTNLVWRQGVISGTMNASACTLYLYTSNSTAPVYVDDLYMALGSTVESGGNKISNSGFESGTNGWDIVGNFLGSSAPVSTYKHSGTSALLLKASAVVASGGSSHSVKQNVTGLTSGAVHTLSFWYYATNAVDFAVRYSGHPAMATVTELGAEGTVSVTAQAGGGFEMAGKLTASSNSIHLSANTTTGKICRVMWRDSLFSGSWQQYGLITSGVSSVSLDVPITGQHRYYQIVQTELAVPGVDVGSGATGLGTNTATLNGNVSSTGAASTTVYLCWDTSDKGTASTNVWAHVVSLGVRTTGSFSNIVSGLTANATYCYRCCAVNMVGVSFSATAVSFSTLTLTPAVPSGLVGSPATSSQINLTWSDNSTNEIGFKIERKTGSGGTYAQIATVGTNTTSYANTGLSAGTQYYYRIRAYNGSGDSAYSAEANATTLAAGSLTPAILSQGYDDIMKIQITGTPGNWLISDLCTRQPQSGYEWWYIVGSKIIKTSTPLTNEPWNGNQPGRVLKMGGKIGLDSFNRWSNDGGWYYDANAGMYFERADCGGVTTFMFR